MVMEAFIYKAAKLFPGTVSGKIVASLGYISAATGIALAVNYFLTTFGACDTDTKDALVISSLIVGLIQLLLAIGFTRMVWALTHRDRPFYKLFILTAAVVLFFGQLAFMIGYGFAMGTSCTT